MHNFKEKTLYIQSTQNNTHLTSILNISLQTLIRQMTLVGEYTICCVYMSLMFLHTLVKTSIGATLLLCTYINGGGLN